MALPQKINSTPRRGFSGINGRDCLRIPSKMVDSNSDIKFSRRVAYKFPEGFI